MNTIGTMFQSSFQTSGGSSAITNGKGALESSKITSEKGKFEQLLRSLKGKDESESANTNGALTNISSSQIAQKGRLNGDWAQGFSGAFTSQADKNALPSGAAANQANPGLPQQKIDKTSELYEKSLEMESYIVKMMISSMRKTVIKAEGSDSYAKNMYEDMLFDEYAAAMTKNAGFGLADQMYLQLKGFGTQA